MIPVDQEFMHDPANGTWGDCMRACVASLLDLPREAVPHFFAGGVETSAEFDRRVADFLATHGLIELQLLAPSKTAMHFTRDCYHLIYGHTERGTYHAVVGLNGAMVHDPHPSRAGLLADKNISFAYLVRTGRPQEQSC